MEPCSKIYLFLAIFSGGNILDFPFFGWVLEVSLVLKHAKKENPKSRKPTLELPHCAKALVWMTTFGRYNMYRRPLVFRNMGSCLQDDLKSSLLGGCAWRRFGEGGCFCEATFVVFVLELLD